MKIKGRPLGSAGIADKSITMAKLVQEIQDLINGALQKSGGIVTGNIIMIGGTYISGENDTKLFALQNGILSKVRINSQTRNTPLEGDLRWDAENHRLQCFDGTEWKTLAFEV